MIQSPEVQSRIATLRAKSDAGTITDDELREAIRLMRADRMSAAQTASSSRRKAVAAIPEAASMLSELEGL